MVFTQELYSQNPRNSRATPSPTTDGQRVYAVFPNGHFVALDFAGNILWTNFDLDFVSCHGFAASPIFYGDLLITPINHSDIFAQGPRPGHQTPWDKSFLLALDKNTGEERWRAMRGMTSISSSTPVIIQVDGRSQIVSMVGDVTQGFDPATGELIWTARSGGQPAVPSPAVGDGMVFVTSTRAIRTNGTGDVTNTHTAWQQGRHGPSVSSFLHVAPVLYTAAGDGSFAALNATTGEVHWSVRLGGGRPDSSPIYADGKIYVTTHEGITTVFRLNADPRQPAEVVAANDIGVTVQASVAVAGNQLFLRTDTELWAIGN
jgi:outer membrane protein assembly factor BamB